MPRQLIYISFAVVMVFLAYHLYNANVLRLELKNKLGRIQTSFDAITKDTVKLESDIGYLEDVRNLEKEARARFNYRAPNEKLIIVAPQNNQ